MQNEGSLKWFNFHLLPTYILLIAFLWYDCPFEYAKPQNKVFGYKMEINTLVFPCLVMSYTRSYVIGTASFCPFPFIVFLYCSCLVTCNSSDCIMQMLHSCATSLPFLTHSECVLLIFLLLRNPKRYVVLSLQHQMQRFFQFVQFMKCIAFAEKLRSIGHNKDVAPRE